MDHLELKTSSQLQKSFEQLQLLNVPEYVSAHTKNMLKDIDIVLFFSYWVKEHTPLIVRNYNQKGGWEGWAQIELALALKFMYSDWKVTREQHVFLNTRKKVDLLLTKENESSYIIELKCESLNNQIQVARSFSTDIDRFVENEVDERYSKNKRIAMALTVSYEGYNIMKGQPFPGNVDQYNVCEVPGYKLILWIYRHPQLLDKLFVTPTKNIDIIGTISKWAIERFPTIGEVYKMNGGWEGWAQVELADIFDRDWNVTREQHVFIDPTKKVDLLLTKENESSYIIEFKCESTLSNGFADNFSTDIDKFLNYEITKHQPSVSVAVALTISTKCKRQMLKKEFKKTVAHTTLKGGKVGDDYELIIWYCYPLASELEGLPRSSL